MRCNGIAGTGLQGITHALQNGSSSSAHLYRYQYRRSAPAIQCATDKAFKNIVKTTTVGKNKTKAAIKGLKKNTTYYVRVRYYDGTGYSTWSSVKKIKTKKK